MNDDKMRDEDGFLKEVVLCTRCRNCQWLRLCEWHETQILCRVVKNCDICTYADDECCLSDYIGGYYD